MKSKNISNSICMDVVPFPIEVEEGKGSSIAKKANLTQFFGVGKSIASRGKL